MVVADTEAQGTNTMSVCVWRGEEIVASVLCFASFSVPCSDLYFPALPVPAFPANGGSATPNPLVLCFCCSASRLHPKNIYIRVQN